MEWKLILAVTAALILATFTVQNVQVVEIRFLFWKIEMSRSILLLVVFLLGGAAGWALAATRRRHRRTGT